MKKVLALLLSLVLILIPLSSVVVFADPVEGYEQDGNTFTIYTHEGYKAVEALIKEARNADPESYKEVSFVPASGIADQAGTAFTIYTTEGYNVVADIITSENYETYKAATITLANDLVFPDEANNFTILGPDKKPYCGTFDGAGHTISGLQTATDTSTRYRALIGIAGEGCTVKDLTITNSKFVGLEYVSAIIGNAADGDITVSNVHIRNTIIAAALTNGNNVGGLCGRFNGSTAGDALFENCTVDAKISSFRNAVGICGGEATANALSVTIRNCVVGGEIETTVTKAKQGATSGFFGWTNGVNLTIENSACIASLKSACNECGFVDSYVRGTSKFIMTNVIGIGPAFGVYASGNMEEVTFTNCKALDLAADLSTTNTVALWNKPGEVSGVLTIDGNNEIFETATLPLGTLGDAVGIAVKSYMDNYKLFANAMDLITKLSGISIEGVQLSKIDDEAKTLSIRLVGTINVHYSQIEALGFSVAYTAPDSTVYNMEDAKVTTVYDSILENDDGNMVAHTASEFGADYIFALTLKDVPAVGTCVFTVEPFAMLGTYGFGGTAYAITFTDGAFVGSTPVLGGI